MTKSDFNKAAAKEIGALEALDTVRPDGKDHAAMFSFCDKQRQHQLNLLVTLTQYVGNGMAAELSEDTATRVITYLREQQQVAMFLTPQDIGKEVAKQLQAATADAKFVKVRGKKLPVSISTVKTIAGTTIVILLLLNLLLGRIDFAQVLKFLGLSIGTGV
jgi:hypothetical protein